MKAKTWLRVIAGLVWFGGAGCTALREIPRGQYTNLETRKGVRVETRDGLEYEFDLAHFSADSLVGMRRRDVEGPFDEFATVRLAYDDLTHVQSRKVDWYRTGLIGGGALAAVVAAGLQSIHNSNGSGAGGGGKGGGIP